MNQTKWKLALLIAALLASCGRKRAVQLPTPGPIAKQNLVVLLADEDGKTGRIAVSGSGIAIEINQPNFALRLPVASSPPATPFPMDPAEIQRIWGNELAALPKAQISFSLYFELNAVALSNDSLLLLPQIVRAIEERKSTDVSVTGHTDTTGDSAINFTFGLNRANTVRTQLEALGIKREILFVSSHGDKDLLVSTPRNTSEPKNRRVEVIVR